MVTYKLQQPVKSILICRIFSHYLLYSKQNHSSMSLKNSPFRDPKHGHILTEDLQIVWNNKLKKLTTK